MTWLPWDDGYVTTVESQLPISVTQDLTLTTT